MLDEDRDEAERVFAASDRSSGLVVLPERRRLDDGSGVYEKGLIDFVKDLRAEGITVAWADAPERRAFIEKRSAAEVIWGAALGVPGGVLSAATWAALVRWFGRSPQSTGRVRVEVLREKSHPDGTTTREWMTYEGTGAEVAELMQADPPTALQSKSSEV
ncbi:hypothetical protein MSM1_15580 [Mycobacterium sp. SM1]|uniref:hypothetical protein n=1 Tax=Mycobacterium sp. SM1 TaxID=2816243 RepID=UPI001BCFCE54|nr:hypothetical protein [Mycobacterium sp. SM1]MBS4729702.1 hypothetical protein [Mycobacterium sp. SM1]